MFETQSCREKKSLTELVDQHLKMRHRDKKSELPDHENVIFLFF